MKKILIAFDGTHFSEGALQMAGFLHEKSPVLLTGSFLPQVDYASLWDYSSGGRVANLYLPLAEDEDAKAVQRNIDRFKDFCLKKGIEHRVHKDFFDFTLPELKKESRFSDLMLLSSESFFENFSDSALNDYLKEALHEMECPVMVVPELFEFPRINVLAYDGTASSVYAIRQFSCLFPEFAANPTILFFADEKGNHEVPDEANILELAGRHFPDLTLLKFEANPKKYFSSWLMENKGALVVTGAFGRSGFSRLWKKSFISYIIREHQLPVFIAHR